MLEVAFSAVFELVAVAVQTALGSIIDIRRKVNEPRPTAPWSAWLASVLVVAASIPPAIFLGKIGIAIARASDDDFLLLVGLLLWPVALLFLVAMVFLVLAAVQVALGILAGRPWARTSAAVFSGLCALGGSSLLAARPPTLGIWATALGAAAALFALLSPRVEAEAAEPA